jgi:predicted aspartyl protease
MTGSIHSGEAIVPVTVRGPHGLLNEFQSVLDTGFSGWLTLSSTQIARIGLVFREEAHYLLADGSETAARLFEAETEWFGIWRRILVVEMDGGPLLGMSMLGGCSVTFAVIEGGAVQIQPLK